MARKKTETKEVAPKRTSAVASTRNIRITPRKVRLVVDLVRGKSCEEAYSILSNTNKAASEVVLKTIRSAAANAVNNFNMPASDLYVSKIYASDGPRLKRYMPRAKGSASGLVKRMSHLYVEVSMKGAN